MGYFFYINMIYLEAAVAKPFSETWGFTIRQAVGSVRLIAVPMFPAEGPLHDEMADFFKVRPEKDIGMRDEVWTWVCLYVSVTSLWWPHLFIFFMQYVANTQQRNK